MLLLSYILNLPPKNWLDVLSEQCNSLLYPSLHDKGDENSLDEERKNHTTDVMLMYENVKQSSRRRKPLRSSAALAVMVQSLRGSAAVT